MSHEDDDFILPGEGPPSNIRLAQELHALRRENERRWEQFDGYARKADRFWDDWDGRPEVGKKGLGVQLRQMLDEWHDFRLGGRVLMGIIATVASGIGYFLAHLIDSWRFK